MTTFTEFIMEVDAYKRAYPSQRYGQAYFNVLADVRPSIAEAIRGTLSDPFYAEQGDDPKVLRAITFTHESWDTLKGDPLGHTTEGDRV